MDRDTTYAKKLIQSSMCLDDAIKMLVDRIVVFPDAIEPGCSPQLDYFHDLRWHADAFQTQAMIETDLWLGEIESALQKADPKKKEERWSSVFAFGDVQAFMGTIVGYAAGLRAAGFDQEKTAQALSSLLRIVREKNETIRNPGCRHSSAGDTPGKGGHRTARVTGRGAEKAAGKGERRKGADSSASKLV